MLTIIPRTAFVRGKVVSRWKTDLKLGQCGGFCVSSPVDDWSWSSRPTTSHRGARFPTKLSGDGGRVDIQSLFGNNRRGMCREWPRVYPENGGGVYWSHCRECHVRYIFSEQLPPHGSVHQPGFVAPVWCYHSAFIGDRSVFDELCDKHSPRTDGIHSLGGQHVSMGPCTLCRECQHGVRRHDNSVIRWSGGNRDKPRRCGIPELNAGCVCPAIYVASGVVRPHLPERGARSFEEP